MRILNKIVLGVLFCGLAVPSMGSLKEQGDVDKVADFGGGGGGTSVVAAAVVAASGEGSSLSSAAVSPRAGEVVPEGGATAKDTEVTIFDVGQGNCVLVKHGNEAMLFDAGSKEDSFSKLYDRLFRSTNQRYRFGVIPKAEDEEEDLEDLDAREDLALKELEAGVEEELEAGVEEELEAASPSKQTKRSDIHSPCSEHVYTHRHGAPKKLLGEKGLKQLAIQVLAKIGTNTVKAVVVSHGDIDHYNLLPKIFPVKGEKYIENLILGGAKEDYLSKGTEGDFLKWVRENTGADKKIRKLIYTGEDGAPSPTYFRAYSAAYADNTDHELLIINALRFTEEGPQVEILSMNSGHATIPGGRIYRASRDTNSNSVVLRVKFKDASLILPGDADECTWDFIINAYDLHERRGELETRYLLLSHHGAELKGSNSKKILDCFKPKICFISTGVYPSYKHPQAAVLDILEAESYVDERTEARLISYFRGEKEDAKRKRKPFTKHIYSTLDDGTIEFFLQPELKLEVTRSRRHALQEQPTVDIYFQRKDTLQRIYGSFAEFKKRIETMRRVKSVFFVQCSPQYNLILPLTEDMDDVQAYYLYTLHPSHKKCTRGIGFEISKLALTTG